MSLSQLVEKFGDPDEIVPDSTDLTPRFLEQLESRMEILTDEKGNLVALYRNRGLFPTESRTELALERFRHEGVEVTRMGNDVANIGNRNFVLGLLAFLYDENGLDSPEGTSEDYHLVPYCDIELVPVTVRVTGLERVGVRDNQEIPAILWKEKDSSGAPEPGNSIDAYWKEAFQYNESHVADWRIIFINPNPKDGDVTKVFPAGDVRNYPGVGLGRFYERRIPRPGEPPPGPLPPNWDYPQK
ncbi:MAG: hypothetical protein K9N23_17150 [Akkermansiaceae bacterium]|nr:hypothetical protein [Akkermansiaceae bacterium]MCF7733421.1 hypothetical protein [Akkermansiaceae bacterium]